MKDGFIKYLNTIGITTQPLLKKIEEIYKDGLEICKEDFADIFVDEYIKEDGTREYEDITFFSEKYQFGARQFLTKYDYVILGLSEKFVFFEIQKQNYDFKKSTEKSRLNLHVVYEGRRLEGNFKASKENCDFLRDMMFKYVKPNLKP